MDDVAAVLPRVDNDSVAPSRSDDLTAPPPTKGDVREPRVEKLVGRCSGANMEVRSSRLDTSERYW